MKNFPTLFLLLIDETLILTHTHTTKITNNRIIMCVLCAIVNALEKAKKKIPLSFSNAKEEEKKYV